MILLFLLLVAVIAIFAIRAQSRRQHREMMSAVNPERLAQLDAATRTEARRALIGRLWIIGAIVGFVLLGYSCSKLPSGFGPNPETRPAQTQN